MPTTPTSVVIATWGIGVTAALSGLPTTAAQIGTSSPSLAEVPSQLKVAYVTTRTTRVVATLALMLTMGLWLAAEAPAGLIRAIIRRSSFLYAPCAYGTYAPTASAFAVMGVLGPRLVLDPK